MVGALNLGLAVTSLLTARLGLLVGVEPGEASPIWPPTGLGLAALLLLGFWMWPGIMLGSMAANGFTSPPAANIPTAIGTTLACPCAYWALRKIHFRTELDRLKDALALVFLAAFGAMLISSTIGTTLLMLGGDIRASDFLATWLTWWTGDAMGVLLVTPLLLTLVKLPWTRDVDTLKSTEIIALLAVTFVLVIITEAVFGILFLTFPLIVWVAWRFHLPGAAPVGLLASTVAITAALRGTGVFAGHSLAERMVILQMFNGSVALVALLLSVALVERQRSRAELERTCSRLGEVINHLDQAMRPTEQTSSGIGQNAHRTHEQSGHLLGEPDTDHAVGRRAGGPAGRRAGGPAGRRAARRRPAASQAARGHGGHPHR
ncbi:MASE1 domain-containing protein [Actinopolymorpha rutila]|uniref:Integral membrane sensor domain MASE1 n=1 Tax=Actinopolymorpha rutila TaxID=446787 RepID=A0A852ZGR0_9ACTN|nr:integral membrane sensor domain MASE1 [Actinopolymorpha rutila]